MTKQMRTTVILISFFMMIAGVFSQQRLTAVNGVVYNDANDKVLGNVHVINLNTVKGGISNYKGEFEINASMDDVLYFSFLGFKTLKIRVTNDLLKYGNISVKLTELGIALEEVIVSSHGLTGFAEIDIKNIPIYNNYSRYAIAGLPAAYEGGSRQPNAVGRAVKSILNPVTSIYNIFARKNNQLRKLRKIKKDDEIRNLLQGKFNRETLTTLLEIDKVEIDEILRQCSYSKKFIKTANDLQIMDAMSECYEEFKVLNKKKK